MKSKSVVNEAKKKGYKARVRSLITALHCGKEWTINYI